MLGNPGAPWHLCRVNDSGAYMLRETTRTTGLDETVRAAVRVLAHFDIPHLVVGGLALQEHGYYRVTLDVDLVVPDILEALEFLTADMGGPFVRVPGVEDRVRDQRNDVFIDLLPAGRVLRRGCQVPFPQPKEVADEPRYISLVQLIALKLDSWSHSPVRRLKDKVDVIELIKELHLPRELKVDEAVRHHYVETWDALAADK